MSKSNIDKEVIWRLLAAAREQYLVENRPHDNGTRSSGIESDPNFLLEFLAEHLMTELDEANEEKVAYEREQFPDLRAGMVLPNDIG
jgi:hypothetical protein